MAERRAVLVRADAAVDLGTGHVMRCLALAEELRERQMAVYFAIRRAPGDLRDLILDLGYPLLDPGNDPVVEPGRLLAALGRRAEWVVVDHYARDATWLAAIRAAARSRLVIDDLADRRLACEVLVDGNLDASASKYEGRIASPARLLLGPRYALLRREFAGARARVRDIRQVVERVVVSMGGSDESNVTAAAIAAARAALPAATIDVVLGPTNPNEIRTSDPRIVIHRDVKAMADLLVEADMALGAAGTSALERCSIGVPMINVRLAANQHGVASAMAAAGVAIDMGWHGDLVGGALEQAIVALAGDVELRRRMHATGMALVDGFGARRVGTVIDGVRLRRARWADRRRLWEWANDPTARRNSLSTGLIPYDVHETWLRQRLADPDTELLVGESGRGVVGQLRLDRHHDHGEVSISVAPEHRGGTGGLLLRAGIRRWRRRHPTLRLLARVKASNGPSRTIFDGAGFELIGLTSDVVTYELRPQGPPSHAPSLDREAGDRR